MSDTFEANLETVRRELADYYSDYDEIAMQRGPNGLVALDALESQNQALQEERDRWEARAKRPTAVAIADLDEQIAALQGRIDRTLEALNTRSPFFVELRQLLAPTQETDPATDECVFTEADRPPQWGGTPIPFPPLPRLKD